MPNDLARIDFDFIKRDVSIEAVLARFNIELRATGNRLVGCCPIHHGSNPKAFVVDLRKQLWRCFGDCDRGGSVLDLVVELERTTLPEAARRLMEWFPNPVLQMPLQRRLRMADAKNAPSHKVYVVEGEGDKAWWTRVGAAWPSKGNGLTIQLSALPLNGRLVLRPYEDEEAEEHEKKGKRR